ncbi:MAG: PQQ-binding-like beta-propeller repeat protein [Chloroflexota bacterium]
MRLRPGWAIVLIAILAACSAAPATPAVTPAAAPSVTGAAAAPVPATATPAAASAIWPVFDFDPSRSGTNPSEDRIGPGNVAGLEVLWRQRLPDVADSTPVYRDGRLYLTLRDGGIVAVDARNGKPLWSKSTVGPKITNSSPALDPSGKWVYSYGLDGYVHKYATADGQEVEGNGWPARVTQLTQVEKESSALNLANDRLYVTTSGYLGDQGHYDGHLVVIDLATGGATVFNTLCTDARGLLVDQANQGSYCGEVQSGVWARAGAVVDPSTGNVFLTTGNGPWNGSTNWGDTVLELSGDGHAVLDTYTPTNQAELNDRDVDLGSTAPALLPEQPTSKTPFLAVQGGKDGELRLLDRRNLSGQGRTGQLGGELQILDAPGKCDVFTAPAVWAAPDQRTWLFVATNCGLAGYVLTTDGSGRSSLVPGWQETAGGTSPIVANGVLYVAHSGAVDARDPTTGRILWSSPQAGPKGTIGSIHWESPVVVDGRLFISDGSGNLTAFGLAGAPL